MKYRCIIDSLTLEGDDEPKGLPDISTEITRDDNRKGILSNKTAALEFHGKGFDYIYDKFYNEGYCNEITIKLQYYQNHAWKTFHDGLLKLKDTRVFEWKKTIEVKVSDNNFSSRIDNNKSLEAYLFSDASKNNVAIDPAEYYRVTFFDPAVGALTYTPQDTHGNNCYRVYEAFRFLVEFMSDGEVGFASDLFDIGGELEGVCLTFGYVLNFKTSGLPVDDFENTTNHPKLSFDKLYTELQKKYNLGFIIDTTAGNPVLRIERASTPFTADISDVVFQDIDRIETRIVDDALYSSIKLGGHHLLESEVDATTLSYPSSAAWIGFATEIWAFGGQCNQDLPLDLTGEFIVDSNTIEDCLGFGSGTGVVNANYQQDWFIIETTLTSSVAGDAVLGDPFGTAPAFIYNPNLRNSEIAKNYYGFVPNSIVNHLSQNTGGKFTAAHTNPIVLSQFPGNYVQFVPTNDNSSYTDVFGNDVTAFDNGNNYNTGTGEYVLPFSGQFTFQFQALVNLIITNGSTNQNCYNQYYRFNVKFERRDGGGALIQAPEYLYFFQHNQTSLITSNATFNGNTNDKITVYVRHALSNGACWTNLTIRPNATFSCTAIEGIGGIYMGGDPTDYKALQHLFEYPMSFEQFLSIESNPTGLYEFSGYGEPIRRGYIDKIRYKNDMADVILLSSQGQNKK